VPLAFVTAGTSGGDAYQANVTPGTSYRVRVEQPPFSAVLMYDTSLSIAGYWRPEYHKVAPVQPSASGGRTEAIVRELPRLKRNDKGGDVKRLQGLLVANGFKLPDSTKSDGTFDGGFGEETERAVQKLTGSKVVDGAQWKRLLGV